MNATIHKTTKSGAHRKEAISLKEISFGAGHSSDFWWNIHFMGKDKNGLSTTIEIQMGEEDRVKFLEDFSAQVESWKKHINERDANNL